MESVILHKIAVIGQWLFTSDQILVRHSISGENLYTLFNAVAINVVGTVAFYFGEGALQRLVPVELILDKLGIPRLNLKKNSNHKIKLAIQNNRWPLVLIFLLQVFPFSNFITPGVIASVEVAELKHGLETILGAKILKVILITQFL